MNENLAAVSALLGLAVVLTLLVPVEVSLSAKDFATVAEQLLWRLNRSVFLMDALVLR